MKSCIAVTATLAIKVIVISMPPVPGSTDVNSVALRDAPLVGENPTRIIKTHLPTKLCPYSEQAKYIYVTRHPVSCFASIVDYNRTLLGPAYAGD